MRRTTPPSAAAAAAAFALILTLAGCAPSTTSPPPSPIASTPVAEPSASPSPEPARPALGALELSTAGLGPLALGAAPEPDPMTSMVAFDPVGCTDAVTGEEFGIGEGDPGAGLWRTDPTYAAADPAYGPGTAFGVGVDGSGAVNRIDLYSSDIPTDGGVRIGDPGESVSQAHPDATIVEESFTDIHVVERASGLLQIEVAKEPADMPRYWEGRAGTVVYIHAVTPDLGVFSVAASGNLVGVCGS